MVAVNNALEGAPVTVNEDAEGKGWFLKLKVSDPAQFDGLMKPEDYKVFLTRSSNR